jgi:transposase
MNRNRIGRRYDREFKNNAVALVRGGAHHEVARDLGVSKWSLRHWVRPVPASIWADALA